MIITLDLQSESPIYVQLRNKIIEGIASSRLKPGDPLPSVRMLAKDLGVNMHTINKAYQLLKHDGFIQIHRQKGVVINPDGMPPLDKTFMDGLKESLRPLISEGICRGMTEEKFIAISREIFRNVREGSGNET